MSNERMSIEQLTPHLNSLLVLNPDAVMSIIDNTLVSWVHRSYKDASEYQPAYDKFINQTYAVILREPLSHSRDEVQSINHVEAKDPQEIVTELSSLLDQLPPENAIEFLSELTGAWCLSCPKEKVRQYYEDENISDIKLAETLFLWLLRPFDFFH